MINFLKTLGVSRENLATSSIIQIVNHGISFGDSVHDESMTGELLKRLSNGGNHVKSLSINELKKVLKYLSRIPLEGHDSGKLLKVAFSQKGLMSSSFLQADEPNYFAELEFCFLFHSEWLKFFQKRTWSCSNAFFEHLEQLHVLIWQNEKKSNSSSGK